MLLEYHARKVQKYQRVVISRKSNNDIPYYDQKEQDKMTNNDLQNTTQKTKDRATRTQSKTGK